MSLADDPQGAPPFVDPFVEPGAERPVPFAAAEPPIRPRSGGSVLAAATVAFLLGGGLVGLLAWHGDLARVLPHSASERAVTIVGEAPVAVPALETRLALLEDRFSRLDQQANTAAGSAGRAEALLIAEATRRAIDRGQPLGYLADQLRTRFANGQPRAVETLIAFSQRPVTLSTLDARLDALAPQLATAPRDATTWSRVQRALSGLFTIRSDARPLQRPEEQIGRAKLLLAEGQVTAAADAITRLPGADAASDWSEDARRFGTAQQALDVIESTAMNAPPPAQSAPEDSMR